MRRRLCALALAALLCVNGAACAASGFDFSGLALEELLEIREQLDAEIDRLTSNVSGVFESGVYLVGRDIPEGDYVLREAQDALFSSVLVRAGEEENSTILLYSLINRQADIHLRANTWLTLSEALAAPLEQAEDAGLDGRVAHEGSYLVGRQIPAGTYTASIVDKAPLPSYSVYSDILGNNAQLVKFEVLHDEVTVELNEGDYIELSGCILTMEE